MKKQTRRCIHPRYSRLLLTVVAAICIGAACSRTTHTSSDAPPTTSFLPQPVLLQPGQAEEPSLVYHNPQLTSGGYNKVILEPVTIWADAGSLLLTLSPEKQQAMAETFQEHVYNELSKNCEMVTTAGPQTIRIRLALTDAERGKASLNTISTFIPGTTITPSLTGFDFSSDAGTFASSASAEGFATDSKTGVLLWEGIDRQAGQNVPGATPINSWDNINGAFIAWAEQFRQRLKKMGVCTD